GSFFDPADLVQVKYEMVRRAETGGASAARAASAFGFSRQSLYTAKAALHEQGLAGLIPGKPGPKGGHKLTEEVVSHLEELLAALAARYEQLRHVAAGGHAGGWRHGLGVLVAKGMACWMATCAALPAAAPEHGGPPTTATPQAGASLPALNPSLPAPDQEGG